jgi:hypothetical protein
MSCGCFERAKGKEMNRYKTLILALVLCVLMTGFTKADDPNEQAVTIVLTGFDMNESRLELQWNIKNDSDHDIWVCDDIKIHNNEINSEIFMNEDNKTLMIRRRFDVPYYCTMSSLYYAKYTRLRPGEKRPESLSLPIPVYHFDLFVGMLSRAEYAKRLVLEIGYYNEDLPELILNIIEVAEKLNSEDVDIHSDDAKITYRYFPGLVVSSLIGGLSGFNSLDEDFSVDPNEQICVPYTFQALTGEQVLRLEINGVHIPMVH